MGSGPGSNECIETEIFVDSETEGPEDFLIFIFVISPSQQIQIIPQRMIKQITIIDGEFIVNASYTLKCWLLFFCVCVCVREKRRENLCIRVCVHEREIEIEGGREGGRERDDVSKSVFMKE